MIITYGNANEKQALSIKNLYDIQAKAIVEKDIFTLKKLHSNNFISIGTDGNSYPENEWEESLVIENEANNYLQTVYSFNKISVVKDIIIAYVTRRCTGTNNREKPFNTEIELRDVWEDDTNGNWLLKESETISRTLFLNGVEVKPTTVHSTNRVMLQGCGDVEH